MDLKHRRAYAERAGGNADGDERESVAARQLVVGWGRQRETVVIWLRGTLDRETRALLETELDRQATDTKRLVVDLSGLDFIDASGVDTLARIHSDVIERGDRLSFRHGQHVAQRPLALIRAVQPRPEWAPRRARLSDQDSG